jgi:hypothetical protein
VPSIWLSFRPSPYDAAQVELGLEVLEVEREVEHGGVGDGAVVLAAVRRAGHATERNGTAGDTGDTEAGQARGSQEAAAVHCVLRAAVDRLADERLAESLEHCLLLVQESVRLGCGRYPSTSPGPARRHHIG